MGSAGARAPQVPRRRVLAALAVAPAALGLLAGCSTEAEEPAGPDPLVALADTARADAALAAAAVAADPALAPRLDPLRTARTEHAAALDAEIARIAPPAPAPTTTPTTATPSGAPPVAVTLVDVRAAVQGSGAAALAVALDLQADRIGLVASIAACCTTYAELLV
jgi:hypothetical protein